MKITLSCSKYLKKINKVEIVKNLFDFNFGSALTEIVEVNYDKEMKAFLLLFNTSRNTNLQLAQSYGRDKLNTEYDLVSITNNFQREYKIFLEQEVVITGNFFENILRYDNNYLIASYNLFKRFCDQLEIKLPKNIRFQYYLYFRENLKEEFQNYQERYDELVNFFDNPISIQNNKFAALLEHYDECKNLYIKPLQECDRSEETLCDLYIDPYFSIYKNNILKFEDEENIHKNFHDFSNTKTIHDFFYSYFLLGNKCDQLKENYNMAFVLGQPGQGKTSFCYKLIFDYLEKYSDLPPTPIIFVKIRDLVAKDFINNPLDEISNRFNYINFNEDEFILVLDGLDEAYMSGGITDNDLKNLYERLKKRSNNKIKIILTSRFNYLNISDSCFDHTLVLQLNELNDNQIVEYCSKFQKFYPESSLIANIDSILNKENYEHIKELLRQAVLIYFIAISNIEIDEKDSKSIIYDKIFDSLAQRSWDSNGQLNYINTKVKSNPKLYKNYLREYIRNIAFEIYQSPNLFITIDRLLELESTKLFIKRCFTEELSLSDEKIKDISKYLLISFYFQQTSKDTSDIALEFFHNSLWEFLTAEYFWEENKKFLLKKDSYEEYEIIDKNKYFDFLDRLVGNKNFEEFSIKLNLIDIIRYEEKYIKNDIYEQSIKTFNDLLQIDFLLRFEYKKNSFTAVERATQIFNVFWCFIHESSVNLNKKSFDFSAKKISYLFKDFGIIGEFLSNINIISNEYFSSRFILHSILTNIKFFKGDARFHIDDTKINNSSFEHMMFLECMITKNHFKNVKFNNCTMYQIGDFFYDNNFEEVTMNEVQIPSIEWYEEFLESNSFDENFTKKHKVERRIETDYDYSESEFFYIVSMDSNI
ncbi:NACHT domain-containing protein [Chryseobacterium sp.]|uniref:NACHT domain-containing protein n=1 Tax=Chryseobacterium sp. TaxID=1871047 RepID=UPI0024E1ED1E|nr:NACHT domain-containing protein [Chryseobacterium sp.]